MKVRTTAALLCLFAVGAGLQLACSGGQTGVPSANNAQPDCSSEVIDLDASTALGFPPAALWDAYEGRYESLAEWRDPLQREPTRVTVEVSRDEGTRWTCKNQVDDNAVRVPIVVRIDTEDHSLAGTVHAWLEGDLNRAQILLTEHNAPGGLIEFVSGRMRVDLSSPYMGPRMLVSIEQEP